MASPGRPSKFTPEAVAQLLALLAEGCQRKDAAAGAGIHIATFCRWYAAGRTATSGEKREFYESVKVAEAKGRNELIGIIRNAAKKGQWQAGAWILERRWPDSFGLQRTEIKEALKLLRDSAKLDAELRERRRTLDVLPVTPAGTDAIQRPDERIHLPPPNPPAVPNLEVRP